MKELPVLELRDYPIGLLESIIKTKGKEATDRKLKSYGYGFNPNNGRGRNRIYTITSLPDSFQQFRSYCVFTLGFPANCDFKKLRDFIFYFLGNDDFNWRPDEMMEEYLRNEGRGMARQTIANYRKKLENLEYVASVGDFVYYKVYKEYGVQKQTEITREEYCAAWREYFNFRKEHSDDDDSVPAYSHMYNVFGGVPRKQCRPLKNVFYIDELNYLYDLVSKSINDEVSGKE